MKKRTQAEWQAIGNQVTEQRLKAGYRTIQQLADAVRISAKTLGGLEAGRSVSEGTLYDVQQHLVSAVSGGGDDEASTDTLLYQRPQGLSDERWEEIRREGFDFIEYQIDRATRERGPL